MCLATVTAGEDKNASGFGWKVFRKGWRCGKLYPEYVGNDPYEISQWYEAYGFTEADRSPYTKAFHVFESRKSALDWVYGSTGEIRRVQWRHQCARGGQSWNYHSLPVAVALEIKILPRRKAKGKKRKTEN